MTAQQEQKTIEAGKRVLMRVCAHRGKDDYKMISPFIDVPDALMYPDYSEVIDRPMSINLMKKSLKAGNYVTLDDLRQDFELMADNCEAYNDADTPISKDARELLDVLYNALEDEETAARAPSEEVVDTELKGKAGAGWLVCCGARVLVPV